MSKLTPNALRVQILCGYPVIVVFQVRLFSQMANTEFVLEEETNTTLKRGKQSLLKSLIMINDYLLEILLGNIQYFSDSFFNLVEVFIL